MSQAGALHDLAVIGSGIGGLTAAALAARAGLDVVVFEAHTRPGGCAGDFVRKGITLPVGATLLTGFEPGGLHRYVFDRLGLAPAVLPLAEAMQVHLPDRTVRVATDSRQWAEERRRAFPEEVSQDRFWQRVRGLAETAHRFAAHCPVLPPRTSGELWRTLRALRPETTLVLPSLFQTVADLAAACGLAEHGPHRRFLDAQLLISMQCEADRCVALNGALALELYRFGAFYREGGTAAVARDLAASIERDGGAVRYRCPVRALRPTLQGWELSSGSGERVRARSVVANLSAADLAELLKSSCPRSLRRRASKLRAGWGAATLYGLIDLGQLPGPWPQYHQTLDRYDQPLEEGNSCFVSVLPAPPGRSLGRLIVSTHTRVEQWWANPDRTAYWERKERYRERLLQAAGSVVPSLSQRLKLVEVGTPLTFRRFTGRHRGVVGGLPQTLELANLRAGSVHSGLPGLFMGGDTVFPGQGTLGVTLSGINAWEAVQERLGAHCSTALPSRREVRAGPADAERIGAGHA
jgi:C-3',4' desaturase CrtD